MKTKLMFHFRMVEYAQILLMAFHAHAKSATLENAVNTFLIIAHRNHVRTGLLV